MSISLSELVNRISPIKTVLFFGAGSSLPSGAPSVEKIITAVSRTYDIPADRFSLSEITSIAEHKSSRASVITTLRKLFRNLTATGAILNLPLYKWKNIYTTNYDTLIAEVLAFALGHQPHHR
jgi:hypothetical protein